MPEELMGAPAYTGLTLYHDDKGGYSIWVPTDWVKVDLKSNHHGWLFSPYPDDFNTSIVVEKHRLKVTVVPDDVPVLREAFHNALQALPGVEIESTDENLSESVNIFEARFTFLEGEDRRKRWVRNVYWGDGQLVITAQGRTPEDFQYWLPMFYNALTTVEII